MGSSLSKGLRKAKALWIDSKGRSWQWAIRAVFDVQTPNGTISAASEAAISFVLQSMSTEQILDWAIQEAAWREGK